MLSVFWRVLHYEEMDWTFSTRFWIAMGVMLAFAGIYRFTKMIGNFWEWAMDKLENFLNHWPNLRSQMLSLFTIVITLGSWVFVIYARVWLGWAILVALFGGLVFPSALLSAVKEDLQRQKTYLARKKITPDLIAQNPQGAITTAFTHLEECLRRRLHVGPERHGRDLVNLAFGNNGRLRYGVHPNEQQGMRNLLDGTFASFRNPRAHRPIQDDPQSAQAIIDLVELLIRLIEESEACPPAPPEE
jgi:hypothetical protein